MDKRLWFDLPDILRLAEHAASCTTFTGVGEDGRRPCPLVDTRTGTIGSNGRSAEPAPGPVHAVHVDGAAGEPSDHPAPGKSLRLAHTDPDDEFWQGPALLDELRHAAARRACWFTIDVHTDATIDYATHHTREVTTAPADAAWVVAQVAAGYLGPYPAQVARGYHRRGGFVFARFRRDIAWWIALDWRRQPADRRTAEGIRVTGEQVKVIRHPGTGREHVEALTADPGRWWRIDGDTWRWTLADDEVNAGRDEPLSQTWGPDGEQRCTVCHAVDEFDGGDLPSMVGYGYDTWTRCRRCGSSTTTDPMFGAHHNPAPWPPSRQRQREIDEQTRAQHTADGTGS